MMDGTRSAVSPSVSTPPPPRSSWERFVAVLPAACAVHCVLTPFLAIAVPVVAFGPTGEFIAFAISTALAILAVRITSRVHGHRVVWLPVVLGAVIWGASLTEILSIAGEPEWAAGFGGLVLAAGVVTSSRLRHRRVCSGGSCVV